MVLYSPMTCTFYFVVLYLAQMSTYFGLVQHSTMALWISTGLLLPGTHSRTLCIWKWYWRQRPICDCVRRRCVYVYYWQVTMVIKSNASKWKCVRAIHGSSSNYSNASFAILEMNGCTQLRSRIRTRILATDQCDENRVQWCIPMIVIVESHIFEWSSQVPERTMYNERQSTVRVHRNQ